MDIVERLRDMRATVNQGPLRMEAADEIERLRERIQDAELSLGIWDHSRSSEYWLRHPEALTAA